MATTRASLEQQVRLLERHAYAQAGALSIRSAYGKVGLSLGESRDVTSLMTKPQLALYLRAMIDGLILREDLMYRGESR